MKRGFSDEEETKTRRLRLLLTLSISLKTGFIIKLVVQYEVLLLQMSVETV